MKINKIEMFQGILWLACGLTSCMYLAYSVATNALMIQFPFVLLSLVFIGIGSMFMTIGVQHIKDATKKNI